MRLGAMGQRITRKLAFSGIALALLALPSAALDKAESMAQAVQLAIQDLAPEDYPDYVWTFIRRADTVKIKGKGPAKIIAVYALNQDGNSSPSLSILRSETPGQDGSTILRKFNADGSFEETVRGRNGVRFAQLCDVSGKCVLINTGSNGNGNGHGNGNGNGNNGNGGGNGNGNGGAGNGKGKGNK